MTKDSALSVPPGVLPPEAPPHNARPRRRLSRDQYIDGVGRADRVILAQAITLIESSHPDDAQLAQDVLEACLPATGNSVRAGVTGVPGCGKSSVIERLGAFLTRERGENVAVLAIDPSSQISNGSILGDKTRMETLSNDGRAFVRPSPSGGTLGGVSRRTRETMLLCEAAGYRNIIVETVGVGQSETAVRSMVDFFLLLMLSGAGDELQGMKRGIFEMSDLIAINKADGANKWMAEIARREYEGALKLFSVPASGWETRVIACSARTGDGIPELWSIVLEHHDLLKQNGWFERLRTEQVKSWMYDVIEDDLRRRFRESPQVRERLADYEREVVEGKITGLRAAERLLRIYAESKS